MRQIATLAEREVQTLADYLLTLKIQTQLLPEGASWGLWVCDEDLVSKARGELAEYLKDPANARYAGATRAAQALRQREEQEEETFQKRQAELARRMAAGAGESRPVVTLVLIVASLGVSIASGTVFLVDGAQGLNLNNRVLQAVLIKSLNAEAMSQPGLNQIEEGQLWRLVTPIFLHFGPLHLLFNLLMLRDLGMAVEARRGSLRMLALVLVLSVFSNLGQFYLGHFLAGEGAVAQNPLFGGMSGVLYGLFGYVWMKSRFAPAMGLIMHPTTVVFLVGWFFLCMTNIAGPIANGAHAVGLALGIVIGAAPHVLFGRHED